MANFSETTTKVLQAIQLFLAVSLIVSFLYFSQQSQKIMVIDEQVNRIDTKELPEIRAKQNETESKVRELKIEINNLDKTLEKIDKNVEYIRRKIEQ